MDRQLEQALRYTLSDIQGQINILKQAAEQLDVSVALLQDQHGTYLLTPLLLAKAQCLNGLAVLRSKNS